jgi:hypothetical protein
LASPRSKLSRSSRSIPASVRRLLASSTSGFAEPSPVPWVAPTNSWASFAN